VLFGCSGGPNPTQLAISPADGEPPQSGSPPSADPANPPVSEFETKLTAKGDESGNEATNAPKETTSSSVTCTQSLASILVGFYFCSIFN